MMKLGVTNFFERAYDKVSSDKDWVDFFVYYLTIEAGHEVASVPAIHKCYSACDLAIPSWLPQVLSKGLRSNPKRFVKRTGGYRLESGRRLHIENLFSEGTPAAQTSAALSRLETQIGDGPKRDFLHETIKCFSAGANRAAIVMCWNLSIHHLQEHILSDAGRLATFDAVLATNTDKRVKIKSVKKHDDFTEIPESKFIDFCREAKLITGSIFNKLKGRLDERNSAAHPSGVTLTPRVAETYIEDLVENVLKKYAT